MFRYAIEYCTDLLNELNFNKFEAILMAKPFAEMEDILYTIV